MLVKTDFKYFPLELIRKNDLERGQWTECTTKKWS